jgi:hypothetical protein
LSMITSKHSYFWSNKIQKMEKLSLFLPLSRNPHFRWYTVINKVHSTIPIFYSMIIRRSRQLTELNMESKLWSRCDEYHNHKDLTSQR